MLIDWVTARLSLSFFSEEQQAGLRNLTDRIQRYDPQTGDVRFESQAWDSIRSDSHQVTFRVGSRDFWIQGSPARAMGDGDAVFGSGASAALDLMGCVNRMAAVVFSGIGGHLRPAAGPSQWVVSRVDVTANLLLGSLVDVRSALRVLRDVEGGRYRVSNTAGDTVYWSATSKLKAGKAYAKGPHLIYMMAKDDNGRRYTPAELLSAERLIRLELRLGREYFRREKNWHEITSDELRNEHESYFAKMIGGAEVMNDHTLLEKVISAAPTPSQGKTAYGMWLLIKNEGWERAKDMTAPRTYYRNLKILRAAGLSDADISSGRVVEFRRKLLIAQEVTSWADLLKVA